MSLDNRIRLAITEAVSEAGQPTELATRLIAWFSELASGNESLDDRDRVAHRVELLYDSTKVDDLTEEDD